MSRRIAKLSLAGFRGATTRLDLNLDANKQLAVIFGENGTGKSTIVDAVDFVANGSLGPLAARQATPVKTYLPALGWSPASLAVEMTIERDTWKAALSGSQAGFSGSKVPRPLAHVLRRATILELLMAKPSERYERLKGFVDVTNVEAAEASLREAAKAIKARVDHAASENAAALQRLEELWNEAGKPGGSALEWAGSLAAMDAETLSATASEATRIIDATQRAETEAERLGAARNGLDTARQQLATAKQRLRDAEAGERGGGALLMVLLEKAADYLSAHSEADSCPVCEKPIELASLSARLAERRAAGKAVEQAQKTLDQATRDELARGTAVASDEESLVKVGAALLTVARGSTLPPIASLALDWTTFAQLAEPLVADTRNEAVQQAGDLGHRVGELKPALSSVRDRAIKDAGRLNLVTASIKTVRDHEAVAAEAKEVGKRLERALSIVEGHRKAFVEQVLTAISGRVCQLYSKIHPGEGIGDIKLTPDPNPKKRASLNLTGRFNEVCDVPPEGYYSESHLDTLGICVFLALAERALATDRPNILVLDDVLTSVDAPHLDRFISMVQGEAEVFDQVILTTHYRRWFETYRRGMGPAGNACLVELSNWSLPNGVRADRSPLPTAEIEALLAKTPLDRQGVASKAGVLLEVLLSHLCWCYRLRLPASKHGQHALWDMLTAFPPKLKSALVAHMQSGAAATEEVRLQPILDAISGLASLRNWLGAHFNTLGDDVPNSHVVQLGQRALEMARAITCPECGEMAGKLAGEHWRCRCGKKHLSPLAAPDQQLPTEDMIP